MTSEGSVKFSCERMDEDIVLPAKTFDELSKWRQTMFESGLIGVYSNGIGYGNLSVRAAAGGFYISGTATGGLPALNQNHYALVNSWSFNQNSLTCSGRINASAESLSHAAIYESLPEVGAVIHIHHKGMWEKYINSLLTTLPEVLYGTPEMAFEIRNIVLTLNSGQDSILVMGGHEDGIVAWGKTPDDAGACILKYYSTFLNDR
jgi:L-ribulose-5-phosphate 4-epimerase